MKKLSLWSLPPLLGLIAACTGSIDTSGNPVDGTSGSSTGTGSTPGTGGTGAGSSTGTGSTTSVGTGGANSVGGAGTVTGGSVGASGSAGTTGSGMAKAMDLHGDPIYTRFNRLTNEQWERSVQDILKLPTPPGQAMNFETPVSGITDFTNNEHNLTVSNGLWQSYQMAAEAAAALATASDAAVQRIYTGTDAAGFINTLGRRAYRRPLTAAEVSSYQAIFTAGSAMSGTASTFAKGAALVIRAMLQSPHFLYRTELGTNGAPLNGYEVASKLSFWLRNTTPSDALLDAAKAGTLDSADGAVATAKTMLEEPTAVAVMREFHNELLHFDRYETISKINVPEYKEAFNAEYKESSYLFFDRIFKSNLGVRDILTSTVGFVGPQTAALYGVAAPASGYEQRELGPLRVGYFSQLPYLTLYSFNNEPDSIHRGFTLNIDIMCIDPGAPAAMLPPIPTLQPNQTNRDRISALTAGCGGECHNSYINPVGFSFENFDGMGKWRDTENSLPITSAGSYPFAEGVKSFSGAAELMQLMANGAQAHACYAKKISEYALQRDIVVSDVPLLDELKATSMATNGSIKQVMLDLVKNAAFRTRVGGAQ
jgi:hypothetical protein